MDTKENDVSYTAPTFSPDAEEHMSIWEYVSTRIPTLVPPMNPAPNPFKALAMLNRQQWLFFLVLHFPPFRFPAQN